MTEFAPLIIDLLPFARENLWNLESNCLPRFYFYKIDNKFVLGKKAFIT